MANFNKVILLGNLTRDIELRYTQGGTAIGKTGMAINRKFSTQGGDSKEETCFVDLTIWGRQAEVLNQYAGKGRPLFVEGRLEYSTWEDKDSGAKRSKLAVVVENFQFVDGGRGEGAGGGSGGGGRRSARDTGGQGGEAAADFDGIPF